MVVNGIHEVRMLGENLFEPLGRKIVLPDHVEHLCAMLGLMQECHAPAIAGWNRRCGALTIGRRCRRCFPAGCA
ncbi:hypothetical protein [Ralstonia wenshanensis]|nr:hypothetical protein [Ralstonia wenshanensis]